MSNLVAINARPSSPLAACTQLGDDMYLFYANSSNNLAIMESSQGGRGWSSYGLTMDFSRVGPFTISQGPQGFSATVFPYVVDTYPETAFLLLLHDSDDNLVVLYGYEQEATLIWSNITETFTDHFSITSQKTNCTFSNMYFFAGVNSSTSVLVDLNCPPVEDSAYYYDTYRFGSSENTNASICKSYHT